MAELIHDTRDLPQAAEIFGGGINVFSRYENRKTKAPLDLATG